MNCTCRPADFDKTTGELRHKHETVWDGREEQSETGTRKKAKYFDFFFDF